MATVRDIAARIAEHTEPADTPDWDPVGIQLGDPDLVVDTIAVCHEVNDEVVERIEESPVDLLVTYHPLLFTPTNRVVAGRSPGARAYRLIRSGASLIVTHTDFDAAPGGTADALASFFGLRDVAPFGANLDTGLPAIGRYGSFEGTLATVHAMLADVFGPMGVRMSGDDEQDVDTLAVVPGSGSSLIEDAALLADALVTGDVSHHRTVVARDLGLSVVDPGHTATERPGMESLVSLVKSVSELDVLDLTAIDPQTWE